jgi:hypothetical protein
MVEARTAVERRKASAPRARRAPHPLMRLPCCAFRRSASLYFIEAKHPWPWFLPQNSGAKGAARTELLAPSAPAIAGEGDHWSSRSERTVVEGAPDSTCWCRCRTISVGAELALNRLHRVESCAPSTALRAVPLPRYRGGG